MFLLALIRVTFTAEVLAVWVRRALHLSTFFCVCNLGRSFLFFLSVQTVVAERGSTAQSSATFTSNKRPTTELPSNHTDSKRKHLSNSKRQLMVDCFGTDSSDEDVLTLNNDTEFGTDLRVIVDNVICKEAEREPPSDWRITVENVQAVPNVCPPPANKAISNFRIPRCAPIPNREHHEAHKVEPIEISRHRNNPFANRDRNPPARSVSNNRDINRDREAFRRQFARRHEADRRRQLIETQNEIDAHQRTIDEWTQEIDEKYIDGSIGGTERKRITLKQYRELRNSPPVGHTQSPDSLLEFANLQVKAKCVHRPIALPPSQTQLAVAVDEYVPEPIRCLANANQRRSSVAPSASPSPLQQVHNAYRESHQIEARDRASVPPLLGHSAVPAAHTATRNQQADHDNLLEPQRNASLSTGNSNGAAAVQQRHSVASAKLAGPSQANVVSNSVPHTVTSSSAAEPRPPQLSTPVNLPTVRAEIEEPKPRLIRKKLGSGQRKRLRKALAREKAALEEAAIEALKNSN